MAYRSLVPSVALILCGHIPAQAQAKLIAAIDPRAEAAAYLYAASATLAAAERLADAKMRTQRAEIERLRTQVHASAAGAAKLQEALTAAEDAYVADLAARDRAYAQEIAVFRSTVQAVTSTPEGTAALARFNAGDERGALGILDKLNAALDAAAQKRTDIEKAARARPNAELALEARTRGKNTTTEVIERYEKVTKLDPGVPWDWVRLARLYRDAGRLAESLSAAKRAANSATDDRDRAVALDELGNVLVAQGDGPAALATYRIGLGIREALAARDPSNTQWQNDLSVSYERIGEVLFEQGEGVEALAAYRKSLGIDEAFAARDPSNTQWQRDLAASQNRVGDVLFAQGDGAGALTAYRKTLGIVEVLAARDPENNQWQRDLATSQEKLGDLLSAHGDKPGALAAYRKGLETAAALAARDPGNADWQRELSVSYILIADALVSKGDQSGALSAYSRALGIREILAARDPGNAQWQRDLALIHNKIGDLLRAQGDQPGALAAYRKALGIREVLAARDAANATWQRDLVVTLVRLSQITGDKAYAQRALDLALALQQQGFISAMRPIVDAMRRSLGQQQ